MRPQLEPILESHLAAILMGELLRSREDLDDTYVDIVLDDLDLDDEYYTSFELVPEPPEAVATTQFVRARDTTHDHVATKRYPRELLDDERIDIRPLPTGETALDSEQPIVPLYSTPYDPTDEPAPQFAVGSTALPLSLYSVPYERVDLDLDCSQPFVKAAPPLVAPTDWSFESTELVNPPQTASRVIATIVVFVGATLLGLSIALYAT
jgi:hypothetical protein